MNICKERGGSEDFGTFERCFIFFLFVKRQVGIDEKKEMVEGLFYSPLHSIMNFWRELVGVNVTPD